MSCRKWFQLANLNGEVIQDIRGKFTPGLPQIESKK